RAIKRGSGESGGADFEEITYEGYGPKGTAILIETLTDNRNRTAPEMRRIFDSNGGNLGGANSVAYLFERKGIIRIPTNNITEDDLMEAALEAGAENLETIEDTFEVTTLPAELNTVQKAIEEKFPVASSEFRMIPKNPNTVDPETGQKLMKLMDALDENDDVQKVYTDSAPEAPPSA
ncbi:MAG: YebC/PmpR family DNA-binding transcriptional regulator, partial [Planctomycetota bacterium]|nr:YebC/PmpR family DNA-binding transcriptional regulator [Planctomycetota bacterium]